MNLFIQEAAGQDILNQVGWYAERDCSTLLNASVRQQLQPSLL
jgi:hypothetical protein